MRKTKEIIFWALGAVAFVPFAVSVHVGYVVSKPALGQNSWPDLNFLLSALLNPVNISLILGTLFASAIVYFALKQSSLFMNRVAFLQNRIGPYLELTPWIIRLSLVIALIEAGTLHVLIWKKSVY